MERLLLLVFIFQPLEYSAKEPFNEILRHTSPAILCDVYSGIQCGLYCTLFVNAGERALQASCIYTSSLPVLHNKHYKLVVVFLVFWKAFCVLLCFR